MSESIDGWQGGPSPSLRMAVRGSDLVPGVWTDIYDGDRLVVEIVIDLDESPDESAWLFVLGAERAAAVLEQFGFASYRAFVLKFRAAAELVASRPAGKAKREALKGTFPF